MGSMGSALTPAHQSWIGGAVGLDTSTNQRIRPFQLLRLRRELTSSLHLVRSLTPASDRLLLIRLGWEPNAWRGVPKRSFVGLQRVPRALAGGWFHVNGHGGPPCITIT